MSSAPWSSKSTTLTVLARIGFAARGLVYLLVGVFAGAAAFSSFYHPHGIMDFVQAFSSTVLRWSLAGSIVIGLACLATYFAIAAVWNFARARRRRRLLFAAGMLGDAIVYAVVMLSIIGLLIGWPPDQQNETQIWTAWLMLKPYGRFIVGIVGLLILACGIGVVGWVLSADIDEDVALPESEKRFLEPVGRYGLGGRGVAAALVGLYWMVAALHRDPSKALELGGTLQAVQQNQHGWMLLLPLGIAFTASALFDFVEALFHRPARLIGGR